MSQLIYIHPQNPQPRIIKQVVALLHSGAIIVYPTDSGYALGCKTGEKAPLERIIRLRQLNDKHHFTLMCRDLSELSLYAMVDNRAFRLIKNNTPGGYTFILRATKEVPRRLLNVKRKTIGLRVTANPVAQAILTELNQPMMSSTLIMPNNDFAESCPEDIQQILTNQVDAILHAGDIGQQPTTVVDLSGETTEIRRYGSGDPSPFEA